MTNEHELWGLFIYRSRGGSGSWRDPATNRFRESQCPKELQVLSCRFYQHFKTPEIYVLTDVNLNKSFEVHSSFSLGSNIRYRVSVCSIMKAELTFVVMYEPELCVPGIISFLSGMSPITSRSFHIHEGFNSKQLVAITLKIRRILLKKPSFYRDKFLRCMQESSKTFASDLFLYHYSICHSHLRAFGPPALAPAPRGIL